jgi:hypothetical protein
VQTNKSVHFRTTSGLTWLPKAQIENMLVEKLSDRQVWAVIRCGAVWCGVLCCGTVWCGMVYTNWLFERDKPDCQALSLKSTWTPWCYLWHAMVLSMAHHGGVIGSPWCLWDTVVLSVAPHGVVHGIPWCYLWHIVVLSVAHHGVVFWTPWCCQWDAMKSLFFMPLIKIGSILLWENMLLYYTVGQVGQVAFM